MTSDEDLTLDPRRAGAVLRYHTWPHLRQQTVAEHSWNVARIAMTIWPEAPLDLVRHCLFHDLGEVVTGDPPYPVKLRNPQFGEAHREVEDHALSRLLQAWGMQPTRLTELYRAVFKLSEFIEMWEWGLDEVSFGNRLAQPVVDRCLEAAHERINPGATSGVPVPVRERAHHYIKRRLSQHV